MSCTKCRNNSWESRITKTRWLKPFLQEPGILPIATSTGDSGHSPVTAFWVHWCGLGLDLCFAPKGRVVCKTRNTFLTVAYSSVHSQALTPNADQVWSSRRVRKAVAKSKGQTLNLAHSKPATFPKSHNPYRTVRKN